MAEEEFPEFCRKTPTSHGNYGTLKKNFKIKLINF
jgi:hypothetical protein